MSENASHGARDDLTGNKGNQIFGSDVIALALREQNIPYVCLNPGASYRGLHDSLVNYLGNENPKIVVCTHEEHTVAIGQGYAAVTGKPLFAIVHSNVGLMHATMAIFNAWCARLPVIVIGATGPVDSDKRRPWIDWIHTTIDQGALIRGYSKWDDQPASPAAAVESIRRAAIIAQTQPCGPVYVNLDAAVQEAPVENMPPLEDVSRYRPHPAPEPPRAALEAAVKALASAKNPLILSGRASRNESEWHQRIELAERTGARILTNLKDAASFPSTHPLYAGETGWRLRPSLLEFVKQADVIMALDWVDPAGTIQQAFPKGEGGAPTVINVSNDHHIHNGFSMDYQILPAVDIDIPTVPEVAVPALNDGLEKAGAIHNKMPDRPEPEIAPPQQSEGRLDVIDLARIYYQETKNDKTAVISRPLGWPPNANAFEHPLDFLGSNGGGGLGAGPGNAIGAAMALRDINSGRVPVGILGDGDFIMGANALWTASNQEAPLLLIIANNRSYYNDEEHQKHLAHTRHRPVENAPIGQRTEEPPVDLVGLARAQGWDGEGPIENIADVAGAIRRGIDAVKSGKRYIVDVLVKPDYERRPLIEYL